MGGAIAVLVARERPQFFRGIVLSGPAIKAVNVSAVTIFGARLIPSSFLSFAHSLLYPL